MSRRGSVCRSPECHRTARWESLLLSAMAKPSEQQPGSRALQTLRPSGQSLVVSHRSICPRKIRGSFPSKWMSHHTCWVSLHLEHVEVEEDLVARSGVDEPMTLEGPVTLKKLTGQKSSELR